MKIEIITCHNIKNYGSVYQTYATQKLIEDLGYEAEVIDYQREGTSDKELVENRARQSKKIYANPVLRILFKMAIYPAIRKQIKVFQDFLKKYIKCTPKTYFSNEELKKDCPRADVYLSGSDQIWNSSMNGRIELPYFFDFVPEDAKRIAFSTSFGGMNQLDVKEEEITRKLLLRYKAISLREESGREICESLGIKKSVAVLDPTFLLKKEEWQKLQEPIQTPDQYILVYHLRPSREFDEYVKYVAEKKKMKVVHILFYYHAMLQGKFGPITPTPGQVQTLIENATYIITDSFHMTSFSIKYHKQFVVFYPDMYKGRIENILQKSGLLDRHVTDDKDIRILDERIAYDLVDEKLDPEIQFAKDWLRTQLAECEKEMKKNKK